MATLVVVELPLRSGLAKDKVVNTFAVAEANIIKDPLYAGYKVAFPRLYNANLPTFGNTLGSQLGPQIDRAANACKVKLYDITDHLDGSPHGSPIDEVSFTMPAAGYPTPMPEEVAYCVTLEAHNRELQLVERADGSDPDAKPDRPRQRFTGRVYLGPFSTGVVQADGNGLARPTANLGNAAREAFVRLAAELDAIGTPADNASLAVWSRKDKACRGISNVRTDDAFDTQRRRGVSPLSIVRVPTADLVPELELAS